MKNPAFAIIKVATAKKKKEAALENQIKVQKVLLDEAHAEEELERLSLKQNSDCRYFMQKTRVVKSRKKNKTQI